MTKEKPSVTIAVEKSDSACQGFPALAWSPDSKLLVNSTAKIGQGAFLQFRDGKSGKVLRTWEKTGAAAIAWSPDGKIIAIGHYADTDPGLHLWDASTGKLIRTLKEEKYKHGVANAVWLEDGRTVVAMGDGARLQYWDTVTGKLVKAGVAFATACSRDGKLLITGGGHVGYNAAFWSTKATPAGDIILETTKALNYWPSSAAGPTLAWSPDGMSLASHTGLAGQIYLWDIRNGSPSRTWATPGGQVKVAWSADGKQVLAGSWHQISRWNTVPPSVPLLDSFKLDNNTNNQQVSFSPDRIRVAVANLSDRVFLYDVKTGKRLHVLEGKPGSGYFSPLAWSPDGKRLAVALANGIVRLWDPAEGKPVRDLAKGHTGVVQTMAWSRDGKLLATAGEDDFMLMWDPATGQAVRSLQDGHKGIVRSLAWSLDDKVLYSSGDDRTVRAWKADTGKQLDVLDGQRSAATTLGLSPDGKTLAVLNAADACIQVWDLPSRRLLGRLLMLPEGQYLAVSADGHYRGSPKIDQHLVYVVETDKGQETLTPTEFAEKYGWRNDPSKVKLVPETPAVEASPADADRKAAEWVLSLGGKVWVRTKSKDLRPATAKDLPAEAFQLLQIDFQGNRLLTDEGLVHVKDLPNLSFLSITGTAVTDAGLVHLEGLTKLEHLDLNFNITGDGLAHLKKLTNLKNIGWGGAQVKDAAMEHLRPMTKLIVLDLNGATQVTSAGIEHLKGLTGLTHLGLPGTRVNDAGLAHLEKMTNLVYLLLNETPVSDVGLEHLQGLTRLGTLNLRKTRVTDAGLKCLHGLTELRMLDLTATKVTAAGVAALKKALPQCQVVGGPAAVANIPTEKALARSPLDALDPAQIPPAERFTWQPKELVAVLGEHRQRHWGNSPQLAMQPSGKLAATLAADGIRIWESDGLKQVAHLGREKFGAIIPSMHAFSANGERLLFTRLNEDKACELGMYDLKAKTLTWQTLGSDIQNQNDPSNFVHSSSFLLSPDGKHMALPVNWGTELWDIRGAKPLRRHVFPRTGRSHYGSVLSYSPDGKLLALTELDEKLQHPTVRVYNLTAPAPALRVTLPGELTLPAFAPDGRLATTDYDPKLIDGRMGENTLRFWEVSGTELRLLEVVKKVGLGCGFSPHGNWMHAWELSYRQIGFWKMEAGTAPVRKMALLSGDPDVLTGRAVAPDDKTVIVSTHPGAVESYSIERDKIIARHKAPKFVLDNWPWGSRRPFHLAQNGWFILPELYTAPRLWNLGAPSPRAEPPFRAEYGSLLDVSPSGKTLVFNRNGDLVLARAPGFVVFNEKKQALPDDARAILVNDTTICICRAPYDGNPDRPVIFYDVAADPVREVAREKMDSKNGNVQIIRRADDGRTMAWLESEGIWANGRVRAWDVAGAKPVRWADLAIPGAVHLALTANGQTLLVGRGDGWLELWQRQDDRAVRKGQMPAAAKFDPEGGFTVSPDGRRLAFCDKAGRLAIWDIASAKVVWQDDLPGVVHHLAFAPDGRHLLTANSNGTLYVLRLVSPQPAANDPAKVRLVPEAPLGER